MKKTFLFIMALVAVVFMATSTMSCSSCVRSNSNNGFGFVYTATVTGEANGDVALTFPNGKFDVDGEANLGFIYSNDTVVSFNASLMDVKDVLADSSASSELRAFAEAVENDFANQFNATAAKGEYYLELKADVRETATGLELHFVRVFTNRPDSAAVACR